MPSPANQNNRRALILDFDGVLVDTEALNFKSWNQAFGDLLNIQLSGSYTQLVGLSLSKIYDLWCRGTDHDAAMLTDMIKQALLDRKNELFFQWAPEQLLAMPGSVDLIQRAHDAGWYVALASRARRIRLHRTLAAIGFPLHFDVILGTEDIVDLATDRKIHSRAGQVFGIDPADCVVIEDSLSGIRDACAAAIGRVIGLTSALDRTALLTAGAHEVVDRLDTVQLEE